MRVYLPGRHGMNEYVGDFFLKHTQKDEIVQEVRFSLVICRMFVVRVVFHLLSSDGFSLFSALLVLSNKWVSSQQMDSPVSLFQYIPK